MKKVINHLFLCFVLLFFSLSCKEKKQSLSVNINTIQHQCVHRLSTVISYDIFSPPVASRIYAYSNLAYYETVRFKERNSVSIASSLKGFDTIPSPEKNKQYDFTIAAIKSFFKVAKGLIFSKDSLTITEIVLLKEFENATEKTIYSNSIALGDSIANIILKRAFNDNYRKTRGMPKYSVFKEAGKWEQTPPDYADATEPHWNLIMPFLLDSASQFRPPPPPIYDLNKNSRFYKELMEVYTVNKQLTASQDTIAHYWDDNPFVTEHKGHFMFATKKLTPGGHWMGITSILCQQTNANDVKTAKAYALTSATIFDGFISCWDEKYHSKLVRPITVIREHIDPTWNSFLQTPPFPEYTSGHSTITAAAATVLTNLFGDKTAFHDTTELEYLGLERSFNSIFHAADEAAISRLYGGIHYQSAIEEGKKQGLKVGKLYTQIFK